MWQSNLKNSVASSKKSEQQDHETIVDTSYSFRFEESEVNVDAHVVDVFNWESEITQTKQKVHDDHLNDKK